MQERPTRYPNGLHAICKQPACDHYDDFGMFLGCPPRTAAQVEADHQAVLSQRIDEWLRGLVMAYGASGADNLITYLELGGTDELRRRLVAIIRGRA